MTDMAFKVLFALAIATGVSFFASEAQAQCYRCECYRTPYGRECRKVCYAPPRQHHVDRSYAYSAPSYGQANQTFLFELLSLVGIASVIAAFLLSFLATSSRTDEVVAATEEVRAGTEHIRSLTRSTIATRVALEDAMDRRARQSFQRGERDGEARFGRG